MRKKLSPSEARDLINSQRDCWGSLAPSTSSPVMVNVSGGIASAVMWKRCVDRFGDDRVHAVFADTNSEDEDTYRFLDDCEARFGELLRIQATGDIWDCFDQHGIMRIATAGGACKASIELKQKPLDNEARRSRSCSIAVGFTYDEPERIAKLLAVLPGRTGIEPVFPLVSRPVYSDCELRSVIEDLGIAPPRIYADGFVHNNCMRTGGCILAGLSQWAAVYRLNQTAFAYAERREAEFFRKTGFTILRDQRGGKITPYPLSQMRVDIESGRDFGDRWESGCGCMVPMLFSKDQLEQ